MAAQPELYQDEFEEIMSLEVDFDFTEDEPIDESYSLEEADESGLAEVIPLPRSTDQAVPTSCRPEEDLPLDDAVGNYLRKIGRIPLLSHEEEVDLAKRYAAGLEAAQALEGQNQETTTDKKRRQTLQAIKDDGWQAGQRMIESNLRLVVSLASKKQLQNGVDTLEFMDIIEHGNLGLIRAVEGFKHEKGYKFSTYAKFWIIKTIQVGIAKESRVIRIPEGYHRKTKSSRKKIDALTQKLGRHPTPQETVEELKPEEGKNDQHPMTEEAIVNIDRASAVGSLNELTSTEEEAVEKLVGPDQIPDAEFKVLLDQMLVRLSESQQRAVYGYYILELSQEEIAAKEGVSRQAVSQLLSRAKKILREFLE